MTSAAMSQRGLLHGLFDEHELEWDWNVGLLEVDVASLDVFCVGDRIFPRSGVP